MLRVRDVDASRAFYCDVELYVDSHPGEWGTNPAAVASAAPLHL
jgi:hypothetical protein